MPPPAVRPLASRHFRSLWLASIASHMGSFLQVVAASWLMLELTGSPLWVGLMVAAPTLPMLVVAMPAGALADLVDRRLLMLVAQLVMATSAGGMALLFSTGRLTPGLLLGLGLLMGAGHAVNLPAWQAMVSDLVPSAHVASAVALNSVALNVARALGPALGGLLVASAGPGPAFALNAASFLPVAAVVATFPRTDLDTAGESMREAIAGGLRYARHTPTCRWLLATAAAFALTSAVLQAVLPAFTATVLDGAAGQYGLLLGAMGVGAIGGAVTRGRVADRLGRRHLPAAIVAFGLTGAVIGLAGSLPVALAGMAVSGVLWVWILSTLNATAQLLAPNWVRGRIMSLYTVALAGFLPLGAILSGAVADALGPAPALVAFSLASAAIGAASVRVPLPPLRELRPPDPLESWEPPEHPVAVDGDRVLVSTTWVIDEGDLEGFLATMDELRRVRLRTGAFRWRLYRDVGDPRRMTEVFLLTSWEAHLRQHRRIDAEAAAILRRARSFDRASGPVTHHLAAVEVAESRRPDWDSLVAVHASMHSRDGSVPLAAAGDPPSAHRAGRDGRASSTTRAPTTSREEDGEHADRHPDRRG